MELNGSAKTTRKLPVILEKEEAKALLGIPNIRYLTGLRNKAILTLMLNMGLRVKGVINLKTSNVNLKMCKLRVTSCKYIKDRDIVIPTAIVNTLEKWKKRRPKSDYFFCTLKGKKLSKSYIQAMVTRYRQRAKIPKNVTPYTLRHTFATRFYRQIKDIEMLQKILGHSDVSTTKIYIKLANVDVENAMNAFIPIVL